MGAGGFNTALGHRAGANATAGSANNVYIDNLGATESNTIRIGDTQTVAHIAGVITGNGSGLTGVTAVYAP